MLAGALLGVAGSGALAQAPNCRDDLIKADQNIHRTRSELQKASTGTPTAKCAAYRRHVASLNQVRNVFARCDTSPNKAENAKQANAAIATFSKQVRENCPAAAPPPAKKNPAVSP
jgi:hypothetical protein